MSSPFITTADLGAALGADDLAVLDASWYLPTLGRDPEAEFLAARVPGAVRFDIEAVRDRASPLPHAMPDPGAFAAMVGALGVGDGRRVVVYDGHGLYAAPRARWMLRAMGAADVRVLEGGLPRWIAEGRPTESGPARAPHPRRFTPRPVTALMADEEAVAAAEHAGRQVVDARAAARFEGRAPEPRAGLRAGHVPGSRNLPWDLLAKGGVLAPPERLLALLAGAGADPARPTITTCGSGVSACVVALAIEALGHPAPAVYDGSWAEWGREGGPPVATGPA